MRTTVREIAALIQGEIVGNADTVITGISGIKEASAGDITFLANPRYSAFLEKTRASAVIVSREVKQAPVSLILTDNPSVAFARLLSSLIPSESRPAKGIHASAVIGKEVRLGKDISIGPHVVIEDGASIGDRSIIYAACYIGQQTTIGADCLLYPHVSIRERVTVGNRVVINSGTVIGSDGFGFANVEGVHQRIPQIGVVIIEDDVDIGANVTIDRARFEKTVIGKGTKIDNLVQIAHNVVVGENSIIVAQAGISGSTVIGKNVTLAGQAGLVGHISIGDGAVVAAQAGVTKSVQAGTIVSGYPARPHQEAKRIHACVQNLPKLYETIAGLKKKIEELESRIGKK